VKAQNSAPILKKKKKKEGRGKGKGKEGKVIPNF
jgi:hypothetical protein